MLIDPILQAATYFYHLEAMQKLATMTAFDQPMALRSGIEMYKANRVNGIQFSQTHFFGMART